MKLYRKCAGMVVFNSEGQVLVGERIGVPGSWQFPQGGIDKDEDPFQAAKRELFEEVGIKDAIFVAEHPEWLNYDFPEWLSTEWKVANKINKYKGQTQKWFLFYWNGEANDCLLNLHEKEFESLKFIPIEETIHFIIDFKKEVYKKIIEFFLPIIQNYTGVMKK